MSRRQLKNAATGLKNALADRLKGNIRYATVTSVTADDKGATNLVNVVIDNGTAKQNVPSGFNLTEGARVALEAEGLAGSESYVVKRPVRSAPSERGNNPNAIIETPIIAGFRHYQRQLQGGVIVLYIVVIIWQIKAQWRDGVSVGYELEMRQVTGDMPSQTIAKAPQGQTVVKLDGGIDDDDTTIQVEAVGGNTPAGASQLAPRFGYIEFEGSHEVAYYDTYVPNDYFDGVLREQDTPEGLPTVAAAQGDGMLVRGRSIAFALSDLPTDTNHEYRVRAVIGQQKSNWSDWEIYKTPSAIPADQRTANLLIETFDSDVTGWSLTGVSGAALTHAPDVGFMGLGSALVEETGLVLNTNPVLQPDTPVSITAGNEYVAQVYATVDGDVGSNEQFVLELLFDSVNATFSSPLVTGDQMGTLTNNKWVLFEARGRAPYGATTANLQFSSFLVRASTGQEVRVYLDDIRIWEIPNSKDALSEEAIETDGLRIGGGGNLTALLYGSKTWDPAALSEGAQTTTTVTVTGAALGDAVLGVGLTTLNDSRMHLEGDVTATDTVTVRLWNHDTGSSSVNLGSGTLTAWVLKGTA